MTAYFPFQSSVQCWVNGAMTRAVRGYGFMMGPISRLLLTAVMTANNNYGHLSTIGPLLS